MVMVAMKMEHAVTAPTDGTVATVHYDVGEQVEEGAVLVSFEDDSG
jgi:3-methylcrotonyl-CoA carboxylase alpha subunit